ncbi:polyadenylate-binding protein 1-A-like [Spodoptera frugiperda]|uniref:Polyadenylate-binding protein 1-A-like n=1 Tax=Spodoptera frugiperda TaxID=7108 RepID=A0A9R0EIQ4_SPOFR|nr:polyadenylate-binding protein 1-A-like [Spodoptera frugiperda]
MVNQIEMGAGAGCEFNSSTVPSGSCEETNDGVMESMLQGRPCEDISHPSKLDGQDQKIAPSSGAAKILISNLDDHISGLDIQELFSAFGKTTSVVMCYSNGKSTGTAEVVYERLADALKACSEYNGKALDGRTMHIQLATIKETSEGSYYRGGSEPAMTEGSTSTTKLTVTNLNVHVSDSNVQELFSIFDSFVSAGIIYDESGRSTCTAEVIFDRQIDALKAYDAFHGKTLAGKTMFLTYTAPEIPNFGVGESGGYQCGGYDVHQTSQVTWRSRRWWNSWQL